MVYYRSSSLRSKFEITALLDFVMSISPLIERLASCFVFHFMDVFCHLYNVTQGITFWGGQGVNFFNLIVSFSLAVESQNLNLVMYYLSESPKNIVFFAFPMCVSF